MAIGHLHATVVQRSAGQSAVGAAAYAARARMVDARTGVVHDYSRKQADVMFSFVGLPGGAAETLRDPAVLSNAMETRETRKNSQTARKFTMALPSELTPQQREWLVKDFGRENFTRKGLAYHVAIHRPHAYGDQRNVHAHWTVSTRVMERGVFTEKDRASNSREALLAWRDSWEKMVNRQLERHGHAARISMKSLEAQGIDRTPQIHLGQGASALERKGQVTDRGDLLRDIANDNNHGPEQAVGNEAVQEIEAEPEFIDRDAQDAAWQSEVDSAAIVFAEEKRRQFLEVQANDRMAFERNGEAMLARQAASWGEIMQRHSTEAAGIYQNAVADHQPGTLIEAGGAVSGSAFFLLGLFTSWAESITGGTAKAQRRRGPDKAKQEQARRRAEEQKEAQAREVEAVMQEQAREREQYDRRRAQMLFQQQGALAHFDEGMGDKSSLQQAFKVHTEIGEASKTRNAEAAERQGLREGRDRGGPEMEP